MGQCVQRGIQPGPIATFQRWKEFGRHVRKGEKAITLCRPITVKRTSTADDGSEEQTAATWFVFKPFWFVLAQTDGQPLPEEPTPTWHKDKALAALDIAEIPFDHLNGNCLGYTVQHRKWRVTVSIEFPDEPTATHFERYLRSGSGRAFAKRHFAGG